MGSHSSGLDLERRIVELEQRLLEQTKAAARALALEERFERIFRTTPDPMLITRLDGGCIQDVNSSFEVATGYTRDEAVGRSTIELGIFARGPAEREAIVQRLRAEGVLRDYAFRFRRKDGQEREGVISASVLSAGGDALMLSVVHDVTDQRTTEAALRSSEQRLRQIIDLVPHFIFAKDADGRFILVNQATADAYGTTVERLTGRTDADFARSAAEVEHFRADDTAVLRTGQAKIIPEESITDSTGRVRTLSTVKIPFTFSGTSAPALLGVAVDISERKRAEEALRHSEQQYRMLAENVVDVIWTTDLQLRLTYVSASITRVFGGLPEEWLGRTVEQFVAPDSLATVDAVFRHEMEAYGGPDADPNHYATFELEMVRPDGSRFWSEVSARLLRDGAGCPVGVIGVTRDTSERKLAEQERRKLQEQFIHAQKMEPVGRLAGGVAHDLNNMLTPILGYAELLRRELAPDDRRIARIHEILAAGARCRDLVQRLLTFARKQTSLVRPLDLSRVVAEFEPMLRRTLREDIVVQLRLAPNVGAIDADPGQLEQALMNLVINAQDAMPDGGTLTIQTEEVDLDASWAAGHAGTHPGRHVRLSVRDTGAGMSEGVLGHLFEPFFTTKSPGQGTGLGLSTVYGIVQQHRGAIEVESAPREGSTFHLIFPRTGEPLPAPAAVVEPPASDRGVGTVLVVEDEDRVRALAVEVLRQAGYKVLEARDGEDAIEVTRAHDGPLDAMLTDVILPGQNGRVLFERLSAQRPNLRVLFMSGYAADVISQHGVLDPGVSFIQKPFATRALAARMAELLQRA